MGAAAELRRVTYLEGLNARKARVLKVHWARQSTILGNGCTRKPNEFGEKEKGR
jgi:hypothetical protein